MCERATTACCTAPLLRSLMRTYLFRSPNCQFDIFFAIHDYSSVSVDSSYSCKSAVAWFTHGIGGFAFRALTATALQLSLEDVHIKKVRDGDGNTATTPSDAALSMLNAATTQPQPLCGIGLPAPQLRGSALIYNNVATLYASVELLVPNVGGMSVLIASVLALNATSLASTLAGTYCLVSHAVPCALPSRHYNHIPMLLSLCSYHWSIDRRSIHPH